MQAIYNDNEIKYHVKQRVKNVDKIEYNNNNNSGKQ